MQSIQHHRSRLQNTVDLKHVEESSRKLMKALLKSNLIDLKMN